MPSFGPAEPGDPPPNNPLPGPRPQRRGFGPGVLVLSVALSAFAGLMLGAVGTLALQSLGGTTTDSTATEATAVEEEPDGATVLEEAVAACSLESRAAASLGDDGRSLNLDTRGTEDATGLTDADLTCVLGRLDVPDHVINEINSTRALDGRRSAVWDGMSASWSYHPRTGLDLQFVLD